MTNLRRQFLLKAFRLFDILIMVLSFGLASVVVSYQLETIPLAEFLSVRVKIQNVAIFLGFVWIWHLIFSSFGL